MGLKDQILQQQDVETRTVHVDAWGFEVTLRGLTGTDRDEFEASISRIGARGNVVRNLNNIRARLLSKAIVDPATGERVFTTPEDVTALGNKSARALDQLFTIAAEMNGLTPRDVKELEGNSSEADGEETLTL